MQPLRRGACLALAVLAPALLVVSAASAATLDVDQNDGGCNDGTGTPYCTIGAALAAAVDTDTVSVAPGTYVENVVIDDDVALVSTSGRASTTIQGISFAGAVGTVLVQGTTTGVVIQGFTIVGIDNGLPGIENGAVYFRGSHTGAQVLDNEIVAAGDHGFVAEFGATMSGTVVSGNIFSGQTYIGPSPGDCGFANQFTVANVPRQLFVIGGGAGGGNTSNTTFTNNMLSGTAGDVSAVPACAVNGQGNNLATVDSNGATISGNTFSGQTARFATLMRARGPNTSISGNTFLSANLIGLACYSYTQNVGANLGTIAAGNSYDASLIFVTAPTDLTGTICSACGNNAIDPGEDCEPTQDAACPGNCDAVSCVCNIGACCTDGPGTQSDCLIANEADCTANGGLYLGNGTACQGALDCVALLVTFDSMTAQATSEGVLIRWTTLVERDTMGFRVLRETGGGRAKALEAVGPVVPAAGDTLAGASYEVLDSAPGAASQARYYIEDIDVFGRTTRHGPIAVELGVRHSPTVRTAGEGNGRR